MQVFLYLRVSRIETSMSLKIEIEELIAGKFNRGDASAMDMLYAEYGGYLAGICHRYIPDDDKMKDVLQESLIKIYTQIGQFQYRGKGSLKAWISRVTINEALNQLRKDKSAALIVQEEQLPDLPDESPDVSGLSPETIAILLGKLPPGYRAVINLFAIEGKSHKEIGEILGIKPDTSASQFHRAKSMLAKLIKEYKLNTGTR